MAKGIVKWFDPERGFGFVINPQGQDVFVHYSGIDCRGYKALRAGQIVEYTENESERGLNATEVRIVSDSGEADRDGQ